ncbi:MAG: luxQ1 [Myxococcales bacterium]|nr:luxQ1 [Myxococcales bacterium]
MPPRFSAGKRILIVEDNNETAGALKTGLEDLGYPVALAHNGPVALQIAKTFQPDVCLLDIVLPVMDGYELIKRMRESTDPSRQIHYVALTGHTKQFDRQRSIEAGCTEHLVKPVRVHQLARVLEQLYQNALTPRTR